MWREVPELPRKRRAIRGLFDRGVGRGKMLETKMKWRSFGTLTWTSDSITGSPFSSGSSIEK